MQSPQSWSFQRSVDVLMGARQDGGAQPRGFGDDTGKKSLLERRNHMSCRGSALGGWAISSVPSAVAAPSLVMC